MVRPLLIVTGSYRQPELHAYFDRTAPHPSRPGKTLRDLMKSFPEAYFTTRKNEQYWRITGIGRYDADGVFERAGFEIDFLSETEGTDLDGLDNLDELVSPMMKLSEDGGTVFVRHRLLGYQSTKSLLGAGSAWDKKLKRFYMPVGDLILNGEPRPDLDIPDDALDAAWDAHERIHTHDDILHQARKAALAKDVADLDEDEIEDLVDAVGDIPDWFGLDLYPYQRVGAIAVSAGHNLLADGMRVGKALYAGEHVLTPMGTTVIGELRPGDRVIGSSGRSVIVTGVFPQGVREVFHVRTVDGGHVVCDGEHLWTVTDGSGATQTLTTRQIIERIEDGDVLDLPALSPVEYDPRLMSLRNTSPTPDVGTAAEWGRYFANGGSEVLSTYQHASIEVREKFFEGILTSRYAERRDDGSSTVGVWSTRVAEGIRSIALSLGYVASIESPRRALIDHTVTIEAPGTRRRIERAYSEGLSAEMVCISVDAEDHLFVTRDFILTHNTRTSLAVAAMRESRRTLIVCPPVVLTNWQRNVDESGIATLGGSTDGDLVIFRSGRKEPDLPENGVVLISDSLVAHPSRDHLKRQIMDWNPDVFIFDEAHRAKTYESVRTQAMLQLAARSEFPIPMTGTPLFQSPQELASLLEMTGHLAAIFGGREKFLKTYCTLNPFGQWKPRMRSLPELRKKLDLYVWVRRTKDQVLTDLPEVTRGDLDLDVDVKLFRDAHALVQESIQEYLEDFAEEFGRLPVRNVDQLRGDQRLVDKKTSDEVLAYARENGIRYISRLRKAAGLAKVPAAVDWIKDHVASTTERGKHGEKIYTRPLLVWTHHTEISRAMSEVVPGEIEDAAIIMGGISQTKRDNLIADFQDGLIPVLVCQISAAGVGIDLTRSCDAVFVETDWVPALIQQAEERIQGVNQKRKATITTFVAPGTLDDRIQYIQHEKSKVLDAVLGGNNDVSVVIVDENEANASELLAGMVDEVIAKMRKRNKAWRLAA